MKRAALALSTIVLVTAMAWPVSGSIGAVAGSREPPFCRLMTPARMLEDPALAEEWAQALRSAEPQAIAHVRALIAEIRAAHGCTDELTAPAPRLPPGHPPVPDPDALPQGHPPIPSFPRTPLFEAPAVLTI